MEEIPNSEKVFKADLVIIAAGFLGPEKTLAEQFGLKKVRPLCFCPQLCCLVGFLGIFCMIFLQDPRSNFATEKNKFLTSVPKVYAAGGEILHRFFSSTFPSNPERMSSLFSSFRLKLLGLQELAFQKIWVLGSHFPVYLFYSSF